MSIDLEQQLERGLDDLAKAAPLPDTWPSPAELRDEHVNDPSSDRPRVTIPHGRTVEVRRRRRRTPVIAAALAVAAVVVVAVVLHASANRPATVRSAAPVTDASGTSAPAPGRAHWDPSGPSLSDAELAEVVAPVTHADGTTTWRPVFGDHSDSGVVTSVDVVRTTEGGIGLSGTPGPGGQILGYRKYTYAGGPHPSKAARTTRVWLVKVSGSFHSPEPGCTNPPADHCVVSPGVIMMTIGTDGHQVDRLFSLGLAAQTDADLASFGPVGHWTPS